MTEIKQGIVLKCIGGFYYVEAADGTYECRARGIFRKQGMTPVAGDHVRISLQSDTSGTLEEVLERRNYLVRPPVANLDYLVIVVSIVDPAPSLRVVDTMIAIAEDKKIEPVLLINKADLEDTTWFENIYATTGLKMFTVSAATQAGVEEVYAYLSGKVSAFTGNSGVGKSSLLNAMNLQLVLETGETSKKLGRGRHTTRIASLFPLPHGGYIVDTPGFSSLDMERLEPIHKDDLPYAFREFAPFLGRCRFTSCAHIKEPGCAVRQAVDEGKIALSRYESYVAMYDEAKERKEWETK